MRCCVHGVLRGSICLIAITAYGQGAPTQTDVEEQRRRAREIIEERGQRQREPDIRLQPPAQAAPRVLPVETPCFALREVVFEVPAEIAPHARSAGSYVSADGPFRFLMPAAAEYGGHCIGREGIDVIVKRLSSLVIGAGFVTTRIGIPEQDLSSGTLRLSLVPGVIRAIRLADDTPAGDWRSAFPAGPGDLLNLRDIEQGLEQMKRVPSQEVDIDIAPGDTAGESDLVIKVKRITPWRLGLSVDDAGARTTGKRQASLTLAIDNPLGLNDLFNVSLNNDAQNQAAQHGTRSHSLQYSVPWGYWTVSLSDSASHYHQRVQGTNQAFVSSGDSASQEIKIQRLLHRDQASKTTLQFRTSQRRQHSFIDDTEIKVQRRHTAAAELGIAHRRQIGAFQIDASIARREGVPWFGGQDDLPGRTPGSPTYRYRMHVVDIGVLAPFKLGDRHVRWIAAFHGQATRDVLYATDHIAIGNRYTVRGFDGETTLAAERGHYLRNELEFALGNSGQSLYVGVDQGRVGGPGADALVGRSLAGVVLGMRGSAFGFTYDFFTGRALRKPEGFVTEQPALGFQVGYQF